MKLFRISEPGSPVEELDFSSLTELRLGEEGRGRKLVIIPVTGEGQYLRAKNVDGQPVLIRTDNEGMSPENRHLIIVKTDGEYDASRAWDVFDVSGIFNIHATGTFADGQAGNTNQAPHYFAMVMEGTEFRLQSKYCSHWYRFDGQNWHMEAPHERQARLAVVAAMSGEGEWL